MATVPRRLWIAVVAGVVLVVALVGVGLWLLSLDDDVALQVDDWVLTSDQLDQQLNDITGNVLYVQLRDQQDRPIAAPAEGEPWDPTLVAEVLNDNLKFRLAAMALERRGGEVSALDYDAARGELAVMMAATGRLTGSAQPDTLDVVLGQFGESATLYPDGLATMMALRRVIATEMGADPTSSQALDRAAEVLAETASAATIVVDPALGTWDPEAQVIVAVGVSEGGLEPMAPGEDLDGNIPGDATMPTDGPPSTVAGPIEPAGPPSAPMPGSEGGSGGGAVDPATDGGVAVPWVDDGGMVVPGAGGVDGSTGGP